jgi:hypothetical protein
MLNRAAAAGDQKVYKLTQLVILGVFFLSKEKLLRFDSDLVKLSTSFKKLLVV